jgi:hypothetical protein
MVRRNAAGQYSRLSASDPLLDVFFFMVPALARLAVHASSTLRSTELGSLIGESKSMLELRRALGSCRDGCAAHLLDRLQ